MGKYRSDCHLPAVRRAGSQNEPLKLTFIGSLLEKPIAFYRRDYAAADNSHATLDRRPRARAAAMGAAGGGPAARSKQPGYPRVSSAV